MEKITSLSNSYIKYLNSLNDKKNRLSNGEYLIEGYHLVEEAKKHDLLDTILSNDEKVLNEFKNLRTILVTEEIIKKLSTTKNPQNVIGVVKIKENKLQNSNKYIVLDGINDPGNLGTIIRTSLALGVTNFILSKDCVDIYNEKTIRATQGAIFQANLYYTDLENIYKTLSKDGYEIIVTSLDAKEDVKDLTKTAKYALVVGNEANGVSDVSLQYATKKVIIPLHNDIESLNVAMALGIVLYQLEK